MPDPHTQSTFKLIYKIVNRRKKIEKRPKISYNHNPAAKEPIVRSQHTLDETESEPETDSDAVLRSE